MVEVISRTLLITKRPTKKNTNTRKVSIYQSEVDQVKETDVVILEVYRYDNVFCGTYRFTGQEFLASIVKVRNYYLLEY